MFWATFLVLKIVKVAQSMEVASYYWMKKTTALTLDQTMDLSDMSLCSATSATLLSNTDEQKKYSIKHIGKYPLHFPLSAARERGIFTLHSLTTS